MSRGKKMFEDSEDLGSFLMKAAGWGAGLLLAALTIFGNFVAIFAISGAHHIPTAGAFGLYSALALCDLFIVFMIGVTLAHKWSEW